MQHYKYLTMNILQSFLKLLQGFVDLESPYAQYICSAKSKVSHREFPYVPYVCGTKSNLS